ncbi:LysR family transcriptional regulator [Parvularcula sp. ZS-1/3]|uniref:LysR family transcriptional regulator n=1 Tax=Parvularcula mediterranea TaxID=2732508 RepID=A0A7Y3W445_9PROT|nr:LysR family transcriptional regulator [Parvularcula mediterranea]NNU14872.1 LysR family transcriptional regulator [Parvularcula mediterranea]
MTFDWNRMRAFLATAEEGSLSAAARKLGSSQPTLGRQVSALEDELGIALFEREGTRLVLTEGGLSLVEHARAMRDAAESAALAASGRSESIEGSVCLSVGELFAAHALPSILLKLRNAHPRIDIDVVASNSASDLKRREADIAFRAGRPTQPDLVARKVGDLSSALYASREYLDERPRPASKEDLSEARFIGFDDTGSYREFLNGVGYDLSEKNFPVRAENHLVQWEMARRGLGIVTALEIIGEPASGLERVLKEPLLTQPMWLVAHRELKTSRRIRLVFDFLYEELRALCLNPF